MKLPHFLRRSLTTRVTLFTLAILALSVATVALWIGQLLRYDMQAMLEQQQYSTATILAAEINHELADRMRALERATTDINPQLLADTAALNQYLKKRPELRAMFNDGLFVTSREALCVLALPTSSSRVGVNFMAAGAVAAALRSGKVTIGTPFSSQTSKQVLVYVAAPIHDANTQVIAALVGAIDLGKRNFLDIVLGNRYGKGGGVMLVDRAKRVIVSDTNKALVLQALPGLGHDGLTDKFVAGFEGAGVITTGQGEQVLVAAKSIPVANWYLAVHLPTDEAFSPMYASQRRLWAAMALLTLLTGGLIWWMLKRQLLPMVNAAATLAALPSPSPFPAPLRVTDDDEVGQLIAGFNLLLNTLQQREQTLKESEERFRTLIEWTPQALVVHRNDQLLYANPAALRMFGATSAQELLGQSVLRLVHPEDRQKTIEDNQQCAQQGVQPVHQQRFLRLDGSVFDVEVSAMAIQFDAQPALQMAAYDITERKRAELALTDSLREKEALLNEVHHRVKNNLQVISSLLRLEAGRSRQPETSSVMQEMQGRIRTMALLYETLYRTASFASVNLADYLKQIATQVFRAQSSGKVQLQLALSAVQVSMDTATPCGLLVNELISNGLKHAFPDGCQGELTVSLWPGSPSLGVGQTWCIGVSDNGVGLPADFEQRRHQSLGLQLAGDLARQLGGVLDIQQGTDGSTGASFSVLFKPNSSAV
jgi:PAS domain S-box-containing protein